MLYIYIFFFCIRVSFKCPRLLINKEKVGMQDRLLRLIGLRQGFDFDPKNRDIGRDVALIDDCDTGCQLLSQKLGWGVRIKYIPFCKLETNG